MKGIVLIKQKKNKKDKKVNETSYINNNLFASKEKVNISSEKLNYKVNDPKYENIGTTKKLELTNFFFILYF